MNYVIIGGDSVIGKALRQKVRHTTKQVWSTTRWDKDGVALDLNLPIDSQPLPNGPGSAIICCAVTSMESCRKEPILTRFINVFQIYRLIQKLLRLEWQIVYLSSSMVFDGEFPRSSPTLIPSPKTEYGRQKADMEGLLRGLGNVSVVRLAKVLYHGYPLFKRWDNDLREVKPIRPYYDYVMSPVTLDTAVDVIVRAAESLWNYEGKQQFWNCSSPDQISYRDAAAILARNHGCHLGLINPVAAPLTFEHIPKFSSLDSTETEMLIGRKMAPAHSVVKDVT